MNGPIDLIDRPDPAFDRLAGAPSPLNSFVASLLALVPVYGPWFIFVLAFLETCFVTGFAIPSGMATSLGTVLAMDGSMQIRSVAMAALVGGAAGDSVGFWVGRFAGERLLARRRRFAAPMRHPSTVSRLLGRHPAYSVTLARCLSFVRTLMPIAAGMSRLGYRRFLAYDFVGVFLWVGLYLSVGALAGQGWPQVVRMLDFGGALTLVGLALAGWLLLRRAARRRRARIAGGREDPLC